MKGNPLSVSLNFGYQVKLMIPNVTDMTRQQFRAWLALVANGDIFTSRERLIALLAKNAPHDEELKREDKYIKSEGKMFTLEEVAKRLGT